MSEVAAHLQRSATHREAQEVAYEFFALRESMRAWRSTIEASRPILPQWYPSGMYIESWFLHARNVLDFLYPIQKPRRNSLVAWLFEPNWTEVRPVVADETFGRLRKQINRMVAHLTEDRAFEDRIQLEVQEVYEYAEVLEGLIDSFLAALPSKVADWFTLDRLWFEGVPTDFRAEDLQAGSSSP